MGTLSPLKHPAKMRILFSLVFFSALLYSIEGLECYYGVFSDENASKDPPKITVICPKWVKHCTKEIEKGGVVNRKCFSRKGGSDGCTTYEGTYTECLCSSDKCNAASSFLPSYTLWISTFVATIWCKYAFESL